LACSRLKYLQFRITFCSVSCFTLCSQTAAL
jgi:hypothetical protein